MKVSLFLKKIQLPKAGRLLIKDYKMSKKEYYYFKKLFYEDNEQFFIEVNKSLNKEQLYLYLYVRFACDLYPNFKKRKISKKIYFNTFYDLTIWYQQCVRKKHKIGLIEEKWLALPLQMKIFRLGRLQFELDDQQDILHVHIPEKALFNARVCDEAFVMADKFFDEKYQLFDCTSWLLSTKLNRLLDSNSNILKFQNRFKIQKITYSFPQAEERIFKEIREDKENYPESTSLQRKAKQMILNHEDIGIGYGILERKEVKKIKV